ncbi:MAG: hypothetical protein JSW66_18800 [Phycisphaerales bacterium]|nr:MAG: hypothetical protein JSW66_18800 [Phycisphaerales bacterium]
MNEDKNHLRLLSIFHYIVGAITALFACFPLIHVAIGIAILCGAFEGKDEPPKFVGFFLVMFFSILILCGWTLAICMIIAGKKLGRCQARTYCLVIAAIECAFMPFGTILGVFTIIVLMKDSVKELFTANQPFQGVT